MGFKKSMRAFRRAVADLCRWSFQVVRFLFVALWKRRGVVMSLDLDGNGKPDLKERWFWVKVKDGALTVVNAIAKAKPHTWLAKVVDIFRNK